MPEQSAEQLYSNYKVTAANKANWDGIKKPSLRNAVKMALAGSDIQVGSATADNNFLQAERASKQDIDDHFELRVNEAVRDATSVEVALNLPENPAEVQVATNVRPVATPHK